MRLNLETVSIRFVRLFVLILIAVFLSFEQSAAQTAQIWELSDLLQSKGLPSGLESSTEFVGPGASIALVADLSMTPQKWFLWREGVGVMPEVQGDVSSTNFIGFAKGAAAIAFTDENQTFDNVSLDNRHFRWTENGGLEEINFVATDGREALFIRDISADGSRILALGRRADEIAQYPLIWDASAGVTSVGVATDTYTVMSDDGSTIASSAGVWRNDGAGFQPFNDGVGEPVERVSEISADGTAIVWNQANATSQDEVWLWREGRGNVLLQGFGLTGVGNTSVISADGLRVYGDTNAEFTGVGSGAAVWDETHGTRLLQDVLVNEQGLGDVLAGWDLRNVEYITSDGIILGRAVNPQGEAVDYALVFQAVPEPSGMTLTFLALLIGNARFIQRRWGPANQARWQRPRKKEL